MNKAAALKAPVMATPLLCRPAAPALPRLPGLWLLRATLLGWKICWREGSAAALTYDGASLNLFISFGSGAKTRDVK